MKRTNPFFKVTSLVCLLSPQTRAETCGQGAGGSDEVSAGSEGQVGKFLFLGLPSRSSSHLLQVPRWIWEVLTTSLATGWGGLLLRPKARHLQPSLRLCRSWIPHLCGMATFSSVSWDWTLPVWRLCCGLVTWERRSRGVGVRAWAEDFTVLVLVPFLASQGHSAA